MIIPIEHKLMLPLRFLCGFVPRLGHVLPRLGYLVAFAQIFTWAICFCQPLGPLEHTFLFALRNYASKIIELCAVSSCSMFPC